MTIVLRDTFLVDIDRTIFDDQWRDPMIGSATWDEYHAAAVDDKPVPETVQLIRDLHKAGNTMIGLTSRPDKWRKMTMEQLIKHDVPLDDLIMRPEGNFQTSPDLKLSLAQQALGNEIIKHRVAFIIDDREDVIAAFKAIGLSALHIHIRRIER